jgi:predicted nucleic acid-binding protein
MIYVDTSVAVAHLLAEERCPPQRLWGEELVSSRLLEYELWNRLHSRDLAASHAEGARDLLARISLYELSPSVLARALQPFPAPVRTLDALHLATAVFLGRRRAPLRVASYDIRFSRCAAALELPEYDLSA